MKLLIADDDRQIREGIKEGIDWPDLGIEDVILAADSCEALELFKRSEPDIVITDIRMPGMNGLELLAQIRAMRPGTKVVILSAYNDFDYMKKAMQHGAVDYEVKPIRVRSLITLIKRMKDEIVKERVTEEAYLKYKSAYRDSFIQRWLDGKISDRLVILEELAHYCDFDAKSALFCLVMEPDADAGGAAGAAEKRLDGFQCSVERELAEMYPRPQWLLHRSGSRLVAVMKLSASMLHVNHTRVQLTNLLKRLNDGGVPGRGTVSAGFSGTGDAVRIHELYGQAAAALERRFYAGPASVHRFDASGALESGPVSPGVDRVLLREAMRRGEEAAVLSALEAEFDRLEAACRYSRASVLDYCRSLLDWLAASVPAADEAWLERADAGLRSGAWATFGDVRRYVLERIGESLPPIGGERSQNSAMMGRIESYIRNHYREELSVELLAEQAGITPNYFSHLFKKEFGVTFKEHLNRLRVNKARELILHTGLMIYEIGLQVGYPNYSYFIQVFRKMEGYSPSELRKDPHIKEKLNDL